MLYIIPWNLVCSQEKECLDMLTRDYCPESKRTIQGYIDRLRGLGNTTFANFFFVKYLPENLQDLKMEVNSIEENALHKEVKYEVAEQWIEEILFEEIL